MNQPTIFNVVLTSTYEIPEPKKQKQWLENCGDQLKTLDSVRQFSIMAQAKILYFVKKQWNDIEDEVKGYWQYDFYHWAATFTENESINSPASTTIDNKVNVYRDYIAEPCIKVPEQVKVRKTDFSGNLVGDGTRDSDYEMVKPDLMWGNYTKLLNARTPAKEGLMTDELWSAVFDTNQTVKGFLMQVKKITPSDLTIYEQDGLIIAKNHVHSAVLAEINYDNIEDDVWREGISKLLKQYKHTTEL